MNGFMSCRRPSCWGLSERWILLLVYVTLTFALTWGQMTPEIAKAILEKHNEYRRHEGSSDMYQMHWNVSLQERADGWVQQCDFRHEFNFDLGENLFFDLDLDNDVLLRGLDTWHVEKKNWGYTNGHCTTSCHFTQLVWHYTTSVGCSAYLCPTLTTTTMTVPNAMFLACYYYPRGNLLGNFPYKRGPPCSECAEGDTCSDKLCVSSTPIAQTVPDIIHVFRQKKPSHPHRPIKQLAAFKAMEQKFQQPLANQVSGQRHQSQHSVNYRYGARYTYKLTKGRQATTRVKIVPPDPHGNMTQTIPHAPQALRQVSRPEPPQPLRQQSQSEDDNNINNQNKKRMHSKLLQRQPRRHQDRGLVNLRNHRQHQRQRVSHRQDNYSRVRHRPDRHHASHSRNRHNTNIDHRRRHDPSRHSRVRQEHFTQTSTIPTTTKPSVPLNMIDHSKSGDVSGADKEVYSSRNQIKLGNEDTPIDNRIQPISRTQVKTLESRTPETRSNDPEDTKVATLVRVTSNYDQSRPRDRESNPSENTVVGPSRKRSTKRENRFTADRANNKVANYATGRQTSRVEVRNFRVNHSHTGRHGHNRSVSTDTNASPSQPDTTDTPTRRPPNSRRGRGGKRRRRNRPNNETVERRRRERRERRRRQRAADKAWSRHRRRLERQRQKLIEKEKKRREKLAKKEKKMVERLRRLEEKTGVCEDRVAGCSGRVSTCTTSLLVKYYCPMTCGLCQGRSGASTGQQTSATGNNNIDNSGRRRKNYDINLTTRRGDRYRPSGRRTYNTSNESFVRPTTRPRGPQRYVYGHRRRTYRRHHTTSRPQLATTTTTRRPPTTTVAQGPCQDDPRYARGCQQWAKRGHCDRNPLMKTMYCERSCGGCT